VLAAAWSPDGRTLAVVATGTDRLLRVEVVRADGSARRVLVREPVGASFVPGVGAPGPVWSPDGRRLVLSLALPG
jgi:Tol biopolymer transport system component